MRLVLGMFRKERQSIECSEQEVPGIYPFEGLSVLGLNGPLEVVNCFGSLNID